MNPRRNTAGYTIVEVVFASLLLAVVLGGSAKMLNSTQDAYQATTVSARLERESSRALHRIVDRIRDASLATMWPAPVAPLSTNTINFQVYNIEDTTPPTLDDLERIELQGNTLVWTEGVGTAAARPVIWSRSVATFLEGEIGDGLDNNGNGLIDEAGLCITFDGRVITIRLTLEVATNNGTVQRTFEGRAVSRS